MREKRDRRVTVSVTDSDWLELIGLLEKLEGRHLESAPLTVSQLAYGLFLRGLRAAVEQEQKFSRPLSSSAGKILRVKRSQLRQRSSRAA